MNKIGRKYSPTPRPCMSDAYTIGGMFNESKRSIERSVYYLVARRFPHDKFPHLYPDKNDSRILFAGLQRIIDRILFKPITHEELDNAALFFQYRKATAQGCTDFAWSEDMWRSVVDNYGGYPPIKITAFPEGSTVYPQEPLVRVESLVDGYGLLAAHYESSIMHTWAATCRLTACRHWLQYYHDMFGKVHPEWDEKTLLFMSSLMMHDFGARAATCNQENEDIAYVSLYCFPGTDTFEAAYQAYINGAPEGIGTSVKALAHRNVQAFEDENECYAQMYANAQPHEFLSMVADCYDYKSAVETMLLPIAIKSKEDSLGITIVARPDSGDALEQILWTLRLAEDNGLVCKDNNTGLRSMTTLRVIEGDSMRWQRMKEINSAIIDAGFDPAGCLIYGVGGGQRNDFTRDDMSFKYALCAVGNNRDPVLKISESGKKTLPEVMVLRTEKALNSGITIVAPEEVDELQNAHVVYYDGLDCENMFGPGYQEDFGIIQERILGEFSNMPLSAGKTSDRVDEICNEIHQKYKPERALS